jgi:Holliday junction DNA helicase RuvA
LINFIRGLLFEIKSNSIIVECSGIGYKIFCPINDISKLTDNINKEVFLYTYLEHKEDSMNLYGFLSEKTKKGFLGLLKVSGIGPKLALKVFSYYDVDTLFESIEKEDIKSLESIPGVGPKMAKKIIFDLKGVIPKLEEKAKTGIEKDLISACFNLGYREQEIIDKLNKIQPLSEDFEFEFKRLLKEIAGK